MEYSLIYAGQEVVGQEYAIYKATMDANVTPALSLSELSQREKEKLKKFVLEEAHGNTPAVRDPQGRVFLLDGHHSLYLLSLLFHEFKTLPISIDIVFDAKQSAMTQEQFIEKALFEHWFYAPTAEAVLRNPHHVDELENSLERSLLGLTFISIEQKYDVPMKGKYFSPFIQFYLADLIKKEGILTFPTDKIDFKEVKLIRNQLLADQRAVQFLLSQLRPDAPKKLRKFLQSLQSLPSAE